MPAGDRPRYRYGDFPELFWDLDPAAEVDAENPVIIARVLREGRLRHVDMLLDVNAVARELEGLVLPPHVKQFWTMTVERLRQKRLVHA